MKTQLLKSIFFFLLISNFFFLRVNAQIIYTNVNPDVASTNYNLDLDNDGVTDFTISHSTGTVTLTCGARIPRTNNYIRIAPVGSNGVVFSGYVSKLVASTSISSSSSWSNAANQTIESITWSCIAFPGGGNIARSLPHGNWPNAVEGYVGLKLVKGTKNYYGWLRMSVTGATSFTIKDYAYNSQQNQSIQASQGANYALVQSLAAITYCAGNNLSIPFTKQGTFNAGNIFTAQLSNSAGSFSSPVAIGTLTGTASGTINALIPAGTVYGTGYRIRILSSIPIQESPPDNGTNLIINTAQSATISSSANPACGTASLNAPVASGNTFHWRLNGVNIQNATSSSYTVSATGNYSCVVTNGCGTVVSNVLNQVIRALPPGTITPYPSAEACPGSTITLNADVIRGITYQWYTYGGVAITGAISSFYAADSTSPYWVIETNNFGCTKTSPYTYVYIRKPLASISNSRPLIFCAGDSTVLSTVYYPVYQYQWRKNGVNIAGATQYFYKALSSGNYTVRVTNPSGNCDSVSAAKTVFVNCRTMGNADYQSEQLSVFPNPAINSITIDLPSGEEGEIQILNFLGELIYSKKVNSWQMQIDVGDFFAGMYVLRWNSGEYSESKLFSVYK